MYKETKEELYVRNTVHKLITTTKKHRSLFDSMRESTGLGRSAHRMLMIISSSDTDLSQTLLAEKLEISTAAVAVMLKKMEGEGYIIRESDKSDSRFNRISLTQKGADIVNNSKKNFYAIDTTLFYGFDKAEMDALNSYLDRLQKNIEKFEKGETV